MSAETHPVTATDDGSEPASDPVSPLLAQSLQAFRRDLPRLLETHHGRWVAYHGDEQLGFSRTQTELYEKGFARGLKPDEFLVCSIEPEIPDDEITWSCGF